MWKSLRNSLIFFLLLQGSLMQASEVFGRYIGSLALKDRGVEQLAKLDFISTRTESGTLKLMAILTLYLGGFTSDEYISYHYDDVDYNLLTQTLTFSQPDQDLTFKTSSFSEAKLVAVVRSGNAEVLGEMVLTKVGQFAEDVKRLTPLAGEYQGTCEGKASFINLQTYRSTSDTVRVGNPFGAYKVKGQFAVQNEKLCGHRRPCVTNQLQGASYNFFTGALTFFGSTRAGACLVDKEGSIVCGSCRYQRLEPLEVLPQMWAERDPFLEQSPARIHFSELREGLYQGYLFHERRNLYQKMAIHILGYQSQGGSAYEISALGKLYFGQALGVEVLNYRFLDQRINPLSSAIILARTQDDVDAIARISEIGPGYLKGTWYSMLFGKVGSFYASLNAPPRIALDQPLLDEVEGRYQAPLHHLDLGVYLGQTPINTQNPFYPLTFTGYFSYQASIGARMPISGGSYDFYTGKIGFEIEGASRVATGQVTADGFSLTWISRGFATILQGAKPHAFVKEEP